MPAEKKDGKKADEVKGADEKEQCSISESVAEQVASDDAEDGSSDGAAEADEPGDGSDGGQRKDISG